MLRCSHSSPVYMNCNNDAIIVSERMNWDIWSLFRTSQTMYWIEEYLPTGNLSSLTSTLVQWAERTTSSREPLNPVPQWQTFGLSILSTLCQFTQQCEWTVDGDLWFVCKYYFAVISLWLNASLRSLCSNIIQMKLFV